MHITSSKYSTSGQENSPQGYLSLTSNNNHYGHRQILVRRQCGNIPVEISWDRTSGFLQGRVRRNGRTLPLTICGIPKRRVEEGELPKVKRFFDTVAIKAHENWISLQPKLLGGTNPSNENKNKLSIFISHDREDDASKNAVNHLKKEIEGNFNQANTRCSLVFKEEPEGASEWQAFIQKEIQKADLVLLYITKKYLKSNFCLGRIFEAMKALGDEWAKKMRIICNSEMQELLKTSEAWFQYLNECADFWEKEHETIEKGFKDATVGVQMALASEREYLYRNRADIPSFIQGIRIRNRSTVEDLKKDITGLMELKTRITAEKLAVSLSYHPNSEQDVKNLEKNFIEGKPIFLEKDIQESDLAILFVTKDYLKSEDCIYEAMQLKKCKETYRKKIYIIYDQEILELRNNKKKSFLYANECCKYWNGEIDDSKQILDDPDVEMDVKTNLVSDYLKTPCACRKKILGFIKKDVFGIDKKGLSGARCWLTLKELEQKKFKPLEQKFNALIKEKGITLPEPAKPPICEFTPPLTTFTGRESLLRQMEEKLQLTGEESEKTKVAVLSGLGGVGKTQLATKFITEQLSSYNLVWTLNAESEILLQESYRGLARRLNLISETQEILPYDKLLMRINDYFEDPDNQGWLLYFDNAEDPKILVLKLPKRGGQILVTSRTKEGWNQKEIICVPEFQTEESVQFLENLIPAHKREEESIKALANTLHNLPLALNQAASLIKKEESALTTRDYLKLFQEKQEAVAIADNGKDIEHRSKIALAIAYTITIEHLREECPNSVEALHLCAYLHSNGIPLAWLKDWWKEKKDLSEDRPLELRREMDKLIDPLIDFSLLYWEKSEESLCIHRLVQFVIQYDLKKREEEQYNFIVQALQLVAKKFDAYDKEDPKTWKTGGECLPHAISITNWMSYVLKKGYTQENMACLFDKMAIYASHKGNASVAIEYYEKSLAIDKTVYGDCHPYVATTLNNLGFAWNVLGKKKKAIQYYEKALEIKKAVSGTNHPEVAKTLNHLGSAWSDLGEKKKAIEYFEKALEIENAFYGNNHLDVATTLISLGIVWKNLGENKKAIEYFEKALEIEKAFLSESHPSIARILNNLGNAWCDLGVEKKAIEYYTQALEMTKAFLGENHPNVAATLNNLGVACSNLGEKKKAVEYHTQALEIYKAFFGESHPDVAMTLNNLGTAWSALGEKKKAIEYYEKALEMYKAFLGESHPSVAETLNNLGVAWNNLGEKKKAIDYFRQAYTIWRKFYGENHPHTQTAKRNLIRLQGNIQPQPSIDPNTLSALLSALSNTPQGEPPTCKPPITNHPYTTP